MDSRTTEQAQLAEQNVIGSILYKPETLMEINLLPDDFSIGNYREAYGCFLAMNAASETIGPFEAVERLQRETGRKNWLPVLTTAMQACMTPKNAPAYARQVRRYSKMRKALAIAQQLSSEASLDTEQAIDGAIQQLMALGMERKRFECGIKEALYQAVERLDDIFHREGALPGVTSGLGDLDKLLGGFQKSDLYIIGARPSIGKTALLVNLALSAGIPCGIISAEQPSIQMAMRMLSVQGRISASKIRSADLEEEDWRAMTVTAGELNDKVIRLNDQPSPTIAEVARQARAWVHQYSIEALYVDYAQRLSPMDKKLPRHEQVAQVVMGLKELARELDIPVVALAQVNRNVEARSDKRPGLADLKDSGAIEQEADNVMSLYRDEVYNKDSPDKGIAEIEIMKNRHGPTGHVKVVWRGEYMRFENYAHRNG